MTTVVDLIDALLQPNRQAAEAAKGRLLAMGCEIVPVLLRELPASDARRSWEIINLLAKIRDRRAVPAVADYLHSPYGALRVAAAQCLGEIGDRAATEPLLNAIVDNKQSGALIWIVQALGRLGDRRATDALLLIMQETESAAVRYTAIEALGQLGDARAIEPIRCYVNDDSHHVRARAEVALQRLTSQMVPGGVPHVTADRP